MTKVDWVDLEASAGPMFRVWVDGTEVRWAKACWTYLGRSGLTSYCGAVEETRVLLRLVTLARIYREFCGLAWEEYAEMPTYLIVENLPISLVALGILAGRIESDWLDGDLKEFEVRENALDLVTDSLRKELFLCLERAYKGTNGLYSRMYRTLSPRSNRMADPFQVTFLHMDAFHFVGNGFQR